MEDFRDEEPASQDVVPMLWDSVRMFHSVWTYTASLDTLNEVFVIDSVGRYSQFDYG